MPLAHKIGIRFTVLTYDEMISVVPKTTTNFAVIFRIYMHDALLESTEFSTRRRVCAYIEQSQRDLVR